MQAELSSPADHGGKIHWRPVDAYQFAEDITRLKPRGAKHAESFKWDYLRDEILSKYVDPNQGLTANERRERAIDKMLESEAICADVNENGFGLCLTPNIVHLAQRFIADVLGEFSYRVFESARFTSGASTSRKRKQGDAYYKYSSTKPIDVTPGCYNYAYALITATPLWCAHGGWHNLHIIPGNGVTTVPKKNDIDRCIAKEPDMNAALQNSLGKYFRKRLRRFGINLNDQSINQRLAREGSRTNRLCTIDLSSASDLINDRIVWTLLPPDWYNVLSKVRSPKGRLPDGTVITWEKHSSMGNGYTFELESLIFVALAHAYAQDRGVRLIPSLNFHVYGDDIILPSMLYTGFSRVLEASGFQVNPDKSFADGFFRESCGKHYYDGYDVTPFYIRKPIDDPSRVVWLLNRLRAWSFDDQLGCCDPSTYPLWKKIRRRCIDDRLLGGRDVERTDSVVSPEAQRSRLQVKTISRRINGWRAVLRAFQFNGPPIPVENVSWSSVSRCVETSRDSLSRVVPGVFSITSRAREEWSERGWEFESPTCLYPNEYEHLSLSFSSS